MRHGLAKRVWLILNNFSSWSFSRGPERNSGNSASGRLRAYLARPPSPRESLHLRDGVGRQFDNPVFASRLRRWDKCVRIFFRRKRRGSRNRNDYLETRRQGRHMRNLYSPRIERRKAQPEAALLPAIDPAARRTANSDQNQQGGGGSLHGASD